MSSGSGEEPTAGDGGDGFTLNGGGVTIGDDNFDPQDGGRSIGTTLSF